MTLFPAGTFTTPNRVMLIGDGGRFDEGVVSGSQVFPGMLVQDDGAGGIKPHATQGGWAELLFALEQGLQGIGGATTPIGAFDAYAVGVQAQYFVANKGNVLNVQLANGANVAEGNLLMSNGDGSLTLMPAANQNGNLYTQTADTAVVTNTTTETLFDANAQYTIPANFLQAGDVIHVRAQGIVTLHNAADTLNVKLYVGGLAGTAVVATGAVNNAANDEILIDAYIEVRTVGATGTMIANGSQADGVPGTATVKNFLLGSTTLNTTVSQLLALSATWSAASASDAVKLSYFTVDIIRQSGGLKPLAVVMAAVNNTAGTTGLSYSPMALVQARML